MLYEPPVITKAYLYPVTFIDVYRVMLKVCIDNWDYYKAQQDLCLYLYVFYGKMTVSSGSVVNKSFGQYTEAMSYYSSNSGGPQIIWEEEDYQIKPDTGTRATLIQAMWTDKEHKPVSEMTSPTLNITVKSSQSGITC